MQNNATPNEGLVRGQVTGDSADYQVVYPEVFYKVQPFIMIACDQMSMSGTRPTPAMVDQMTDGIYADVCQMYPELAEYEQSCDLAAGTPVVAMQYGRGRGRFRRRGLLRDLIDILFLRELFGGYGYWF